MYSISALLWNPNAEEIDARAQAMLAEYCISSPARRSVIHRPGLWINVLEISPNDCTETPLPNGRGALAGVVFDNRQRRLTSLPEETVTRILRSDGKTVVDDVWGRYILFLKSEDNAKHIVLRDPSAALPCYFTFFDGVTLVFSDLETCPFSSAIPADIDWEFISRFLLHDKMLTGATGLRGVHELLPGERLVVEGSEHRRDFVWSPQNVYDRRRLDDAGAAIEEIRATVPDVINAWGDVSSEVLLTLSGGLDSSIVLSALAGGQANVACMTYRSDEEANNDIYYAQLMAEYSGAPLLEFESVDTGQTLAAASDLDALPVTPKPSRHYIDITGTDFRNQLAKDHGARAIFGGQGGDHLFLDAPRADSLGDYLRHRGAGPGFLRLAWEMSTLTERNVWSVVGDGVKHGVSPKVADPLSDRPQRQTGLLSPSILNDIDSRDLRHPWLKDQRNTPHAKFRQISDFIILLGVLEPYRKGQHVDIVQPLISQPLLDLFFRIPTYVLSHGGVRRGLVRTAFEDRLPPKIIRRVRKGGSMGRQYSSILADGADVLSRQLLNGKLAGRGLFDERALKEALKPSALMRGKMQHSDIMRRYLCVEMWVRKVLSCSGASRQLVSSTPPNVD